MRIHLGVEDDFRPARKAHPALVVTDLPALMAGVDVVTDEPLAGYQRVYASDPPRQPARPPGARRARLSPSHPGRGAVDSCAYVGLREKEVLMRALVIVDAGPASPPPEGLVALLEAFAAWRDRWRSKMEAFEFFAGRPGGWGVFNCDDVELSQAMIEFPFAPFSTIQVHPTVDGDEALARTTQTTKEMMARMAGG